MSVDGPYRFTESPLQPAFPDLRPPKPIDWDADVRRERTQQAGKRSDKRRALMAQADERAQRALEAAATEVYRLKLAQRDVLDERDEARDLIHMYLSSRSSQRRRVCACFSTVLYGIIGVLGLAAAVTGLLVLWITSGSGGG